MSGMKPEHRAMPIGRGKSGPVPVHDPDRRIADSKMLMLVQALDPAYMTRALREQVEASGRNPFAGTAWQVAAIYVRRHRHQRQLNEAVKRARHLALLPYTVAVEP